MHANINVTGFLFSLALPALSIIYRTRSVRVLGGQVFNRRPVLSVMSLFIDHILDVSLFFFVGLLQVPNLARAEAYETAEGG